MLRNAVVNLLDFFYPLGNTPAVCLTQALPPEHDASILLLGCGDARNILFTTYSALSTPTTSLDITCCDIEPAILARNIVLFTLIVDDILDDRSNQIWDLYYHFYIQELCLGLLCSQSQKLQKLSTSSKEWNSSEYGKIIHFCDQGTLEKVRRVWELYACEDEVEEIQKKEFAARIRFAKDLGKQITGAEVVLTGLRSAMPCGMQAMLELPEVHRCFWEHGTTDPVSAYVGRGKNPNPMFTTLTDSSSTIHYGTDPVLGFHLAVAFAPLAPAASDPPEKTSGKSKNRIVETAKAEFRAWCVAFRKSAKQKLTLRFFAGDALAFCLGLHRTAHGRPFPVKQYRKNWSFEPFLIDDEKTPTSFDVIDTSNLVDHLGALNVLIAASPLLKAKRPSTLYTEMLVNHHGDLETATNSLLCGPFATVAFLVGLSDPELCTNASAAASLDEAAFDALTRATDKAIVRGQLRCRMSWKPWFLENPYDASIAGASPIQMDEEDLARLFYDLYLRMFEHEDLTHVWSTLSANKITAGANPSYHRASLVALMWHSKEYVQADWSKLIPCFLDLLENDRQLLTGNNHIQELYLYLHLFNLYTLPTMDKGFEQFCNPGDARDLSSWDNLPSSLSITLIVPRAQLKVLTDLSRFEIASPALSCSLQGSASRLHGGWQNTFCVLQLCFGRVRSHGSRNRDDFSVSVEEDPKGWAGESPLVASFLVPTWVALLEREKALVSMELQNIPYYTAKFVKRLGLRLKIFETTLGNDRQVFISRNRPNQAGSTPTTTAAPEKADDTSKNVDYKTTIRANLKGSPKKIVSLTCRVDFLSIKHKSLLQDGAAVTTKQSSPLKLTVGIGSEHVQYHIQTPLPVMEKYSKVRIARQSSYVEVEIPILTEPHRFPGFIFPLSLEKSNDSEASLLPVNWNMPTLNLDILPTLNLKKVNQLQWLTTHISHMFSTRETRLRDASMSNTPVSADSQDDRVDLKDGLFSMFMHFSGIQGRKARSFGLHKPGKGGVHILVFVSSFKLDLANQTVVLDAAVVPLTHKMMYDPLVRDCLGDVMDQQPSLCNITVSDAELILWKNILPSFTERCRTWKHKGESCEYQKLGQIPIEAGLDDGQTPLCSCGHGQIPLRLYRGWNVSRLELLLKKYATRAAISPCFPVPYVEDCFQKYSQVMADLKNLDTAASSTSSRSAMPETPERTCKACGQGESSGQTATLLCARCRSVRYCSKDCQKNDWKEHKRNCRPA